MPVRKPYRRTLRQHLDGTYAESGKWMYILHPRYAQSPSNYIRAFLLIQKDLIELFDFIEPADQNMPCYSYRIHALLLRTCVEVEANLRAILSENGYSKQGNWNMKDDYSKVNESHRLSSYVVKIVNWHGECSERKPFVEWASAGSLPWYSTYNSTKHNRHEKFSEATFDSLVTAVSGLAALMAAQFYNHEYSFGGTLLCDSGVDDGFDSGIGDVFRIRFPNDWLMEERYEFNWQEMENDPDPFQSFAYRA